MSCYHDNKCCEPCCCRPVKVVCCKSKPNVGIGIILIGALLLLSAGGVLPGNTGGRGNENINVINVNGEEFDQYDYD